MQPLYRVAPLDEVRFKLLPDNVVLPFLCFRQLQGSQDVVGFVAHRINEGVDLAGLFLLVSRTQTAFTRKGSGIMPMRGLCITPGTGGSIIAFHTMRHPATARPQLPVLRKPGVESTKASLAPWHSGKEAPLLREPPKTKRLKRKLRGSAEPTKQCSWLLICLPKYAFRFAKSQQRRRDHLQKRCC